MLLHISSLWSNLCSICTNSFRNSSKKYYHTLPQLKMLQTSLCALPLFLSVSHVDINVHVIFYHSIILYLYILHVLFCCNFSNMVIKLEWTNWSRTLYLCSLQGSIPGCGLIANTWFSSKSAMNWSKDFKSWNSCRLFWLNLKNNYCFFICF